jgi:hypothetical protein
MRFEAERSYWARRHSPQPVFRERGDSWLASSLCSNLLTLVQYPTSQGLVLFRQFQRVTDMGRGV